MAKVNSKKKRSKAQKARKGKLLISKYDFSKLYLLVFAIIFSAIAGYLLLSSRAATIYYVSPSGSDSNACTQSSPCLTFNRAYHVAAPGDTVQIAGGSYGSQNFANDTTKTSATD